MKISHRITTGFVIALGITLVTGLLGFFALSSVTGVLRRTSLFTMKDVQNVSAVQKSVLSMASNIQAYVYTGNGAHADAAEKDKDAVFAGADAGIALCGSYGDSTCAASLSDIRRKVEAVDGNFVEARALLEAETADRAAFTAAGAEMIKQFKEFVTIIEGKQSLAVRSGDLDAISAAVRERRNVSLIERSIYEMRLAANSYLLNPDEDHASVLAGLITSVTGKVRGLLDKYPDPEIVRRLTSNLDALSDYRNRFDSLQGTFKRKA